MALGDLRKCLVALADEDSAAGARLRAPLRRGGAGRPRAGQPDPGRADRRHRRPRARRATRRPSCSGRTATCCRPPPSRSCSRPSRPRARWPGRWRSWGRATSGRSRWCPATPPRRPLALERDRRGGPDRDRAGFPVHQRAGRRGGAGHRRGGGLGPRPRSSTSATCGRRSPRPRATTWRPMSTPWPGTMSRSTWCCVTPSAGWPLGDTDSTVHDVPSDRGEQPGPQPGQTGARRCPVCWHRRAGRRERGTQHDGAGRDQWLRAHRSQLPARRARHGRRRRGGGVNDLTSPETLAHLLRYDSTHGRLAGPGRRRGQRPRWWATSASGSWPSASPSALPWGELGVDVVIESTGLFTSRAAAAGHLGGRCKRVIISAPSGDADATFVIGVNDDDVRPRRSTSSSPTPRARPTASSRWSRCSTTPSAS